MTGSGDRVSRNFRLAYLYSSKPDIMPIHQLRWFFRGETGECFPANKSLTPPVL